MITFFIFYDYILKGFCLYFKKDENYASFDNVNILLCLFLVEDNWLFQNVKLC